MLCCGGIICLFCSCNCFCCTSICFCTRDALSSWTFHLQSECNTSRILSVYLFVHIRVCLCVYTFVYVSVSTCSKRCVRRQRGTRIYGFLLVSVWSFLQIRRRFAPQTPLACQSRSDSLCLKETALSMQFVTHRKTETPSGG